jgi:hypothetical protein
MTRRAIPLNQLMSTQLCDPRHARPGDRRTIANSLFGAFSRLSPFLAIRPKPRGKIFLT